jgi:hypothetical protein
MKRIVSDCLSICRFLWCVIGWLILYRFNLCPLLQYGENSVYRLRFREERRRKTQDIYKRVLCHVSYHQFSQIYTATSTIANMKGRTVYIDYGTETREKEKDSVYTQRIFGYAGAILCRSTLATHNSDAGYRLFDMNWVRCHDAKVGHICFVIAPKGSCGS